MKKSARVGTHLVSAVASLALAAGCGSSPRPPATHTPVCGDGDGTVVEDERCDDDFRRRQSSGAHYLPLYHWYYAPAGRSYPIGSRLAPDVPRTMPGGARVGARVNPAVRGGFGGSAHPAGAGQ